MEGKKIKEFLKTNGFEISFLGSKVKDHYGGKGFYHDGTFGTELYKIYKENKEFFLEIKTTGRPWFFIYKNLNELAICGSPNQKNLILQLQYEIKRMVNNG